MLRYLTSSKVPTSVVPPAAASAHYCPLSRASSTLTVTSPHHSSPHLTLPLASLSVSLSSSQSPVQRYSTSVALQFLASSLLILTYPSPSSFHCPFATQSRELCAGPCSPSTLASTPRHSRARLSLSTTTTTTTTARLSAPRSLHHHAPPPQTDIRFARETTKTPSALSGTLTSLTCHLFASTSNRDRSSSRLLASLRNALFCPLKRWKRRRRPSIASHSAYSQIIHIT